jgi:Uma2 family endonuclease
MAAEVRTMTRTVTVPAPLRLTGIRYGDYVRIRDARGNRGLRMAYHDGVLEITSPEYLYEKWGYPVAFVVFAYAEAFDVACEPAGSTTFRKGLPGQLKGKGKEPDEGFYIGDAVALIRGRDTLDLTVDPPPSLWVEVDNRASSKAKLPLYAALGIPEVWRCRPWSRRIWFGRLAGDFHQHDR